MVTTSSNPASIETPDATRTETPASQNGGPTWVGYSLGDPVVSGQQQHWWQHYRKRNVVVDVAAVVVAISIALGSGASPAGSRAVDAGYLIVFAVLFTLGARCASGFALALSTVPLLLLVGSGWFAVAAAIVALVLARSWYTRRGNVALSQITSLAAALLLILCYLNLHDAGTPRLSAAAAGTGFVVVLLSAIRQSTGRVRGFFEVVTMGVIGVAVFGSVNLAMVLATSRDDLESAAAAAERSFASAGVATGEGVAAVDTEQAKVDLDTARSHLAVARQNVDSWWAATGRLVPLVAQNYDVLVDSIDAIERATITARRAVEVVDVSTLRSETGGIDVAVLAEAEAVAVEFKEVLAASAERLAAPEGPWLVPALVDQLDEASRRAAAAAAEIDTQLPRLRVLPALLGADTPRTYLVLAANPSEARDLGGFAGGYAVLRFDGGDLELVQSGRSTDLSSTEAPALDSPFPDRFRDYEPWRYAQNFTGTPDLGVAASVLREVFPEMGGTPIDGVLYIDPYALGALTDITGPVEIASLGLELDSTSLPQFLLIDQYAVIDDRNLRTGVLDVVVSAVFESLQTSRLPPLGEMIDTMAPMVDQGRLRMVSFDDAENAVLEDLGLAARFRPEAFDDFLSVSHANAGPNKLDPYLHKTVSYDVTLPAPGLPDQQSDATAVLDVLFENRAPDTLSDYVSGNRWGLETGTNRLLMIVHSPLDITTASVDGNLVQVNSAYEYGLWRHELFVAIPRGESRSVQLEMTGQFGVGMIDADATTHDLWVHHQPTVNDDRVAVSVNGERRELILATSERFTWAP